MFSVEPCLSKLETSSTRASSASSNNFLDSSVNVGLYKRLLLFSAFCSGVGNGSSGNTEIEINKNNIQDRSWKVVKSQNLNDKLTS